MEPVTHVLAGACFARAGLNRRAAYATLGMAIAAELPDIDTLWSLHGPISGFEHHRGITHTFIGVPVEAGVLLGVLVLVHRIRSRRAPASSHSASISDSRILAPVRWGVLYGCLLLALLSHILLDYTNNYGVRPLFPFDPHWYSGSIVFIFDPLLFLLLTAGLLLPSIFALVATEVGERRATLRGAGWARAALIAIVALWALRWYEHGKAVTLAQGQNLQAPAIDADLTAGAPDVAAGTGDPGGPAARQMLVSPRVLASPDPFSPFRWYTAADYGPVYLLGTADTKLGTLALGQVLHKPTPDPSLRIAARSHIGRAYLDWSSMPWMSSMSASSAGPNKETTVTFQDLRFMSGMSFLHREGKTPLTGQVILGPGGEVLEQSMDGRSGD